MRIVVISEFNAMRTVYLWNNLKKKQQFNFNVQEIYEN